MLISLSKLKNLNSMQRFLRFVRKNWILISILLLGTFLRFYKLDEIPGEMWGDVIEGYKLTQRVLRGDFYWSYEFGGDGPLFSYLAALISLFFGLSFTTMKLTTSLIGIALIVVVYYFGKEYVNQSVGLLAAFLTAVSKWPLIYSRMAKPHILVALFTALAFFFFLKYLKSQKPIDGILTGLILGLGMYTQAGFWGVPLAIGIILVFRLNRRTLSLILPFLLLIIPFLKDIFLRVSYFLSPSSFFGEKMFGIKVGLGMKLKLYLINLLKNFAMFNLRGDGTFRNNPPGLPHLDFLSGIFFLLGIIIFFKLVKKSPLFYFWLPFFIIQVPSFLDITNPGSTPNAGRSIALLPFVYVLVASGLKWLVDKIPPSLIVLKQLLVLYFLLTIPILNFKHVFVDYAFGLPNHNVPFGRIIARQIDKLPSNVKVYVYSCCWGDWGQPELKGIKYALKKPRKINFIKSGEFECSPNLSLMRYYFVWDPRERKNLQEKLIRCLSDGALTRIKSRFNETIYWEYTNLSFER